MKYQHRGSALQMSGHDARPLADANINPATGLATDYLNHFNEAIMLLEMLSDCPDCRGDFLAWQPKSYREHFLASGFKGRDMAISAYDAADPALRLGLETLAGTMTAVLQAAGAAMADMPPPATAALAREAAALLKPLVARAGAVINGDGEVDRDDIAPQSVADDVMKR
jgi:hypothetical protein